MGVRQPWIAVFVLACESLRGKWVLPNQRDDCTPRKPPPNTATSKHCPPLLPLRMLVRHIAPVKSGDS